MAQFEGKAEDEYLVCRDDVEENIDRSKYRWKLCRFYN